MDPNKLLGSVSWITKDGDFDLTRFPIDSVLNKHFPRMTRSSGRG